MIWSGVEAASRWPNDGGRFCLSCLPRGPSPEGLSYFVWPRRKDDGGRSFSLRFAAIPSRRLESGRGRERPMKKTCPPSPRSHLVCGGRL